MDDVHKTIGELVDGETASSDSFRPCPFCGEMVIYLTMGKDGCINCPNCLVCMPIEGNDHIELIHAWNTRTPDLTTILNDPKTVEAVAEAIFNGTKLGAPQRALDAIKKLVGV